MQQIKRIVLIGPESTGKSTLCELLAARFKTLWVPEYAREYLLTNGTDYAYEDMLAIAKGQLALEDKAFDELAQNKIPGAAPLLFIDTDMYVVKVWSEFVFGKCDPFILDAIVNREYDLYLLCNADLPWVRDELREYPDQGTRDKLYHIYKDILINQDVPWVDISGAYEDRFDDAVAAVKNLLTASQVNPE